MIELPKLTQMAFFSIREPRYRDKVVLLKANKVAAHNKIVFTHAPSMGSVPYYIRGATVKKCKKEQLQTMAGSSISVYAVPIDDLETLELVNDMREIL